MALLLRRQRDRANADPALPRGFCQRAPAAPDFQQRAVRRHVHAIQHRINFALLRRLQREKGLTLLYTSHNMRDIEEVCDRILFLHSGKVLAEGAPEQVRTRFNRSSLEEVFIGVARGELAELEIS